MSDNRGNGTRQLYTTAVAALLGLLLGLLPGLVTVRDLAHEDDLSALQTQVADLRTDMARNEQRLTDLTRQIEDLIRHQRQGGTP